MAELKLKKPICFFDIESTGVNVTTDRIVELGILKIYPNGTQESRTWLVNPEMEIPAEVIAIHGISNEKVANEPTFKELAHRVYDMVKDADLAGYNSNKFDVPMLVEEFMRADIDFDLSKRRTVDVQNIFHKKEKRTLEAAYRFYCDKTLENAHTAEADTLATYEILKAQIDRYEDIENDIDFLSEYSNRFRAVDCAGFIILNKDDQECFSFGKYRNRTVVEVLEENPGYYNWILNAEFPLYTKKILTRIKLRMSQA